MTHDMRKMLDKLSGTKKKIAEQCVVLVFCVLFPGLLTTGAPVSWVTFQRTGDRVTARAQVCLFFIVPYKTLTVDPVIRISDRVVEGSVSRETRRGGDRRTKSENEGFLVILGDDQVAEVPVTPFNLKSVVERSEGFLKDPQATELKLFVVANWKFSVIFGGMLSLLTVAYVVGIVVWILKSTYRGVRRMLRYATGADLLKGDVSKSRNSEHNAL